jgi:sterol desaturase/sphingolipid hydroxylase (fatty acid hydroxylase superfamily)
VNDRKVLIIEDSADATLINKYSNKNFIAYSNVVNLLGFNSEVKFIIKTKSTASIEELNPANLLIEKNGSYINEWNNNNSFYKIELSKNLDSPRIYFKKMNVKVYFDSYIYEDELKESLYSFTWHHFLADLKSLFLLLNGVIFIQFFVFFSITTTAYFLIWKKFKNYFSKLKIQKNMPREGAVGVEIVQSCLVLLCTSILSLRIGVMENYKLGWVYDNIFERGLPYYFFTLVLIFILADAFYYWAHRLMHHKSIYKYTHKIHHNSVRVTPFTTISVNISEIIITSLFIALVMSFLPMHRSVLVIFAAVSLLKNIMIHLGHEILPKNLNNTWLTWLVTATHHEIHHMKFQQNFGIYFRFWDVWMGTEDKDYLKKYEQVRNGNPI